MNNSKTPLENAKDCIDNNQPEKMLYPSSQECGEYWYKLPAFLLYLFYSPEKNIPLSYTEIFKDLLIKDDYFYLKYIVYTQKHFPDLLNQAGGNIFEKGIKRIKEMGINFNFFIDKEFFIKNNDEKTAINFEDLGKTFITLHGNNKKIVKILLDVGADPLIKNQLINNQLSHDEYLNTYLKNTRNSYEVYLKNCKKQIKYDQLNSIDYCIQNKHHSVVSMFNDLKLITKDIDFKTLTFKDILEGLNTKNEQIFSELEKYKEITFTQKLHGKNLLFYAIERNNMSWIEKIVQFNLVSKEDVNSSNQEAISFAINKKKKKIVHYLYENNWFSQDIHHDEKKQLAVFSDALFYMDDFAAHMEVFSKFPIPSHKVPAISNGAVGTDDFYNSDYYNDKKKLLNIKKLKEKLSNELSIDKPNSSIQKIKV